MPRRRHVGVEERTLVEGRYYVKQRLSEQGGMSEVFLGWDGRLGRDVVLKLCAAGTAADPVLEAKVAARANHTNIARLHDLLSIGDSHLLVLEHVDGPSLRATLDSEGALAPLEAVRIARACCLGLAHLHALGIVHRDVKPANILLATENGVRVPKIIDFGISKLLEQGNTVAQSGGRGCLTPDYASPEQAQECLAPDSAQAVKVDAKSDVWAMGVVLHEMLTGTSPFPDASSSLEVMLLRRAQCPTPVLGEIPHPLRGILERALRSYATRTASVARLARELRSVERNLRRQTARRRRSVIEAGSERHNRLRPRALLLPATLVIALVGWTLRTVVDADHERGANPPISRAAEAHAPPASDHAVSAGGRPLAPVLISAPPLHDARWGSALVSSKHCDQHARIVFRRRPHADAEAVASALVVTPKRFSVRDMILDERDQPLWVELEFRTAGYGWIEHHQILALSTPYGSFQCGCSLDQRPACDRLEGELRVR